MKSLFCLFCLFCGAAALATDQIASSPDFKSVSSALRQCRRGDRLIIPAGTATWSGSWQQLVVTKNITIEGAGSSGKGTIISWTPPPRGPQGALVLTDEDGPGVQRVTGIQIKSSTNAPPAPRTRNGFGLIIKSPRTGKYFTTLRRVDHCAFVNLTAGIFISDSFGVSDHNSYTSCELCWKHTGLRPSYQTFQTYAPIPFNSDHFFFHEDENATMNGKRQIITDNNHQTVPYVVRNCTFHFLAGTVALPYADIHGDQKCHPNAMGAITNEFYNNHITLDPGARGGPMVDQRGGSLLAFGNRVTGAMGSAKVRMREEAYEYPGWPMPPCNMVHDTYIWDNTFNGTRQDGYVSTKSVGHIVEGVHFFLHSPTPLLLPEYPHRLVSAAASSQAHAPTAPVKP